jgi:hypothetical protein
VALSRSRNVAAVVLIVALALGVGSSAVLAPEADALVSRSTLTVVDGAVLVSHGGAEFTSAREGVVLAAGDRIRTGTGAAAEITYFEGSSVRLEAETEIVVESLRTEADGGTVIGMMQTLGRTWHVVTKLISGSSRYEVRTPSSTASVRGTIFAVEVRIDTDGPSTTVTTSEGVVVHTAADPHVADISQVRVTAGQESTKSVSKPRDATRAAPPATLREAPARPASTPLPAKPSKPSSDRANLKGTEALAELAVVGAPLTKDRAQASKTPKQKHEDAGHR